MKAFDITISRSCAFWKYHNWVAHFYFFRNQVKVPFDATGEQKETAERFRQLLQVLSEELSDIAVYRIGAIEIDAYILGRLKDGSYGGLKTKVIET